MSKVGSSDRKLTRVALFSLKLHCTEDLVCLTTSDGLMLRGLDAKPIAPGDVIQYLQNDGVLLIDAGGFVMTRSKLISIDAGKDSDNQFKSTTLNHSPRSFNDITDFELLWRPEGKSKSSLVKKSVPYQIVWDLVDLTSVTLRKAAHATASNACVLNHW